MRQHLEEVGVQEVASQGEGGSLVGIMRSLPRVLVFLFGLLAVCLMDNEGRLCLQSFDRGPLRYFRCLASGPSERISGVEVEGPTICWFP